MMAFIISCQINVNINRIYKVSKPNHILVKFSSFAYSYDLSEMIKSENIRIPNTKSTYIRNAKINAKITASLGVYIEQSLLARVVFVVVVYRNRK